jgi:PII-like signaling protein
MSDSPRDFAPELLAAFARVVILWSYVEALQDHLLSFLVQGEPGRMFVIMGNVSTATKTDWIRTLLRLPAVQAVGMGDLKNLLEEIDDLRAEGNTLAHGIWSFGGAGGASATVQTIRMDRAIPIKTLLVTTPDLAELLHRIENIVREFRAVAARFAIPGA